MIRIRSKQPNGHYRAGAHHGPEAFHWRDDAFTPEQLHILEKDPLLEVERVPETPGPPKEAAAPGPEAPAEAETVQITGTIEKRILDDLLDATAPAPEAEPPATPVHQPPARSAEAQPAKSSKSKPKGK
jgi:hypothetical protein